MAAKKKGAKRAYHRKPVDSFEIVEGIPENTKGGRWGSEYHNKLSNTIKLLTPNKRSTLVNKVERSQLAYFTRKYHPEMRLRSVMQSKDKFIVWRDK